MRDRAGSPGLRELSAHANRQRTPGAERRVPGVAVHVADPGEGEGMSPRPRAVSGPETSLAYNALPFANIDTA